MPKLLVIHGPNLNLLGTREPDLYGKTSLDELNVELTQSAQQMGHKLDTFQTNAEHEIVDAIQAASSNYEFLVINPAAYTHTSIAIRDALSATKIPTIEVHLSNIYAREPFRHCSTITDLCIGSIQGLGVMGYKLALQAADHYFKNLGVN